MSSPSRRFDPYYQQLFTKQKSKPIMAKRQAKKQKPPVPKPLAVTSGLNYLQLYESIKEIQALSSYLSTTKQFKYPRSPMSARKFSDGATVIVADKKSIHMGKLGAIASYDQLNGNYTIFIDFNVYHVFRAAQLEAVPSSQTTTSNNTINAAVQTPPPSPAVGDRVEVLDGGKSPYVGTIVEIDVETTNATVLVDTDCLIEKGQNINMWGKPVASGRGWTWPISGIKLIAHKQTVDFESVVIANEKREQILEALEQVNKSDLIFDTWGFADTIEKGKGVSMLFYGPPGTGKTLMAQAIADKLEYKLTIISTADIQTSSPGGSERNIRKHFKEAKGTKNILLFDECDSLIYTRQNVGPILGAQINELLSQLERFDGITIFTTNRLGTLDEAVNRRLALKLEFDIPTAEERAKIWQRMFPAKAPLAEDIDWEKLAKIEISGGYIKNAVLRAVRMAAVAKLPDAEKQITMTHLRKALVQETQAMLDFDNARKELEAQYGYIGSNRSYVSPATRHAEILGGSDD